MIAKATVYLAEDRQTAVPEGDKRARYLLARAGSEIPEAQAAKYAGAVELLGGTLKAPRPHAAEHEATLETREPEPQHRDPKHRKH